MSEQQLENMIVAAPQILSDEWMLIGRQESTGQGGRIDLMAIAPDASLVLIEIKRDRTPREVVAQAIDYAAWVETLGSDDIDRIYRRFSGDGNLAADFAKRFGQTLDEDALNDSHQIIIVASEIDQSSARIVEYLSKRDIAINVLCFQVFEHGQERLLSRAWLQDPLVTQASTTSSGDGPKEPWNGEFYVSFGDDAERSWEDAIEYQFVSAGGGRWYSKTLNLLSEGDRIWVRIPGVGYTGVGRVLGPPEPATSFMVRTAEGDRPVLDVATRASYLREFLDDEDRLEYFVPVKWLDAVSKDAAVNEIGLFGNQNTVCQPKTPKWRHTVERLKQRFPNHGG